MNLRRLAHGVALMPLSILVVPNVGCSVVVIPLVIAEGAAKRSPGEVQYTPAGSERQTPRPPDHAIDWFFLSQQPDRPYAVIGTVVWSYFRECPHVPARRRRTQAALDREPAGLLDRVTETARTVGGDALHHLGKVSDECDLSVASPLNLGTGKPGFGVIRRRADVLRYVSP